MDFGAIGLQLAGALAPIAISAVSAALVWLSHHVVQLVSAKTNNVAVGTTLGRLNDLVTTVVQQLEQTVVAELTKRSANGQLTAADAAAVKQAAVDKLKSYMGPAGLALLASSLKIDQTKAIDLIADKVESAVFAMQQEQAPALPPFYQGDPPGVTTNQLAASPVPVAAKQ